MKTKLLAIALFAVSIPAMATNPKPPEPTSGSQEQSQTAKGGDQHQTATGGKQGQQQSQTGGSQSTKQDNDQSLVSENEVFAPVDVNSTGGGAQVGDVLATGVIGGVHGGSGGTGHGGSANQRQGIKDSANNSFHYESFETNLNRSGLVQGDCWGSADLARGRGVNVLGVGWTFKDGSCIALRNAKGLLDIFPNKEIMAYEVLCGNEKFRSADARSDRQCHANQGNKTASNHQTRDLVAGR